MTLPAAIGHVVAVRGSVIDARFGVRHVRVDDATGGFGIQRGHAGFVTGVVRRRMTHELLATRLGAE